MKLQTFKNHKGLIYGKNAMRIICEMGGVLKIGANTIEILPNTETIMPLLSNGCTGEFKATFTDESGSVYDLGKVTLQGGKIAPPPEIEVEFAELHCRAEMLEAKCEALEDQIRELRNIFDTNSLNFLIK